MRGDGKSRNRAIRGAAGRREQEAAQQQHAAAPAAREERASQPSTRGPAQPPAHRALVTRSAASTPHARAMRGVASRLHHIPSGPEITVIQERDMQGRAHLPRELLSRIGHPPALRLVHVGLAYVGRRVAQWAPRHVVPEARARHTACKRDPRPIANSRGLETGSDERLDEDARYACELDDGSVLFNITHVGICCRRESSVSRWSAGARAHRSQRERAHIEARWADGACGSILLLTVVPRYQPSAP